MPRRSSRGVEQLAHAAAPSRRASFRANSGRARRPSRASARHVAPHVREQVARPLPAAALKPRAAACSASACAFSASLERVHFVDEPPGEPRHEVGAQVELHRRRVAAATRSAAVLAQRVVQVERPTPAPASSSRSTSSTPTHRMPCRAHPNRTRARRTRRTRPRSRRVERRERRLAEDGCARSRARPRDRRSARAPAPRAIARRRAHELGVASDDEIVERRADGESAKSNASCFTTRPSDEGSMWHDRTPCTGRANERDRHSRYNWTRHGACAR